MSSVERETKQRALLDGFKDDGSIRGLFGGSESDSDNDNDRNNDSSDKEEKEYHNNDTFNENDKQSEVDSEEFSLYKSTLLQKDIKIETNKIKGIAHQMWPASELFCRYMEDNHTWLVPRPETTTVLELGAGVGLCGVFMSVALKCRYTLITDLSEAIELINKNINHNSHSSSTGMASQELCWGNTSHYEAALSTAYSCSDSSNSDSSISSISGGSSSSDNSSSSSSSSVGGEGDLLIIAADCVYWEVLYEPFLHALRHLTGLGKHVKVVLSHVKRWKKENKFFNMCKKHLSVKVIYENIEMVPDPVSGQEEEDVTDNICASSLSSSTPLRRQITRVYLITALCHDMLAATTPN